MILPLILLALISAAGLILFCLPRINTTLLRWLIALGAGSMLSVSLVHIFPEALAETPYAVYTFLAGFLAIYLIEEVLTPHAHDHGHGDHSHEDPHEHYDHVAIVSFIAIFVHTLFDGLGIRAGFALSSDIGYTILGGIAIHQIPVSLSLAAIFRGSNFHKNIQVLLITLFSLAAPIGFLISDMFLTGVSLQFIGLVTAWAGGSLLYVATADLLPVIHSQWRWKLGTVLIFFLGAVGMSAIKWFE